MLSSDKLDQKVDWILYAGDEEYVDASEIFDSSYERQRGKRILEDYATHPNADETVKRRAEEAIESLKSAGCA